MINYVTILVIEIKHSDIVKVSNIMKTLIKSLGLGLVLVFTSTPLHSVENKDTFRMLAESMFGELTDKVIRIDRKGKKITIEFCFDASKVENCSTCSHSQTIKKIYKILEPQIKSNLVQVKINSDNIEIITR